MRAALNSLAEVAPEWLHSFAPDNWAEAKQFIQSRQQYGIDLIAPTRADNKWQAKEKLGFDASSFSIDWQAHKARCPADQESISWTPVIDNYSNEVIKIKFSLK